MFKKLIVCFLLNLTIILSPFYSLADDISTSDNETTYEYTSSAAYKDSSPPTINSRAAIVIDRNSNTVLYGKNEHNKVKMASTTKIMTSIVVIENCDLKETVTVSKKAGSTGGSRLGIKSGDKCSINDLLYGLMLCSGNDAAVALAEHVGGSVDGFAEMMNKKALELNLKNTHFVTPHGLDKDEHYTTAYELAILSNYALNNKTFAKIVGTKSTTITINNTPRNISNTNELLGNLNGVYGIKTGFTNGANRCLVTACKRNDLDIISVVLGADTKNFRTTDSIKLIEYAFNNFKNINLSQLAYSKFDKWKKDNLDSFTIYKSSSNNPPLDLNLNKDNYDIIIPIKNSELENISCNITCNKNLIPPLNSNSILGTLNLYSENTLIYSKDIVLSSDLYSKNVFEYFVEILKKLSS